MFGLLAQAVLERARRLVRRRWCRRGVNALGLRAEDPHRREDAAVVELMDPVGAHAQSRVHGLVGRDDGECPADGLLTNERPKLSVQAAEFASGGQALPVGRVARDQPFRDALRHLHVG